MKSILEYRKKRYKYTKTFIIHHPEILQFSCGYADQGFLGFLPPFYSFPYLNCLQVFSNFSAGLTQSGAVRASCQPLERDNWGESKCSFVNVVVRVIKAKKTLGNTAQLVNRHSFHKHSKIFIWGFDK